MGGSVETLNDILRLRDLESRWPGAKQKEIELLAWLKIHPKDTLAERVAGSALLKALEEYGLNPQIFPDPYILCRHSIDKKTGQAKFLCRKPGEGDNINYDRLCFNKHDIEKYELETPDLFNDLQELLANEDSSVVDMPKGNPTDAIDNESHDIDFDKSNNGINIQSKITAQDAAMVEPAPARAMAEKSDLELDKEECREIALLIWSGDPGKPIDTVAKEIASNTHVVGQPCKWLDGRKSASAVRKWIKGLCPDPRSGRPRKNP